MIYILLNLHKMFTNKIRLFMNKKVNVNTLIGIGVTFGFITHSLCEWTTQQRMNKEKQLLFLEHEKEIFEHAKIYEINVPYPGKGFIYLKQTDKARYYVNESGDIIKIWNKNIKNE